MTEKNTKKIVRSVVAGLVLVLVLACGVSSIKVIPEGYVGVRFRFGQIVEAGLKAGPHFKLPVDAITVVDITEQSISFNESAYTKDIQTVENIEMKVNFVYDTEKLTQIIRNIGINNVATKILMPQVQSVLKNEIGQYKAEELVASRTVIQETVEEILKKNLSSYGIVIVSVNIQNIDFTDDYEDVIAEKAAAEQRLLTAQTEAEQLLVTTQAQADAAKIKADAEAYSIQVVNEAMKKMDSDAYVKLQLIDKWDGKLPEYMSDGTSIFSIAK